MGRARAGHRREQRGHRRDNQAAAPYDLTQLKVVNEVLKTIRDRYVDPKRVKPQEMLLSALNYVQRDVAQVIVIARGEPADGQGARRHAGEGVPRRQRAWARGT